MKCASIDLGTNTVLLLVAEYREGKLHELADVARITRLGEGLKSSGVLSLAAMDRTYRVLSEYRDIAAGYGAEKVFCVGTAAMREAANSREFMERVGSGLGIAVKVISARDEAYYTYLSVREDGLSETDQFLIVDVGGGSTEIIRGSRSGFGEFVSLPVGSVKLTEMFVTGDPPGAEEIARLVMFLKQTVKTPFDCRGCTLVGTAGTATTLAALVAATDGYCKETIHGMTISIGETDRVIAAMAAMNLEERKNLRGMEPGRADIILQGIILIREIMRCFDAPRLVVSANGGRYGVLYEALRNQKNNPT